MIRKVTAIETFQIANAAVKLEVKLPSGRCTLLDRVTSGQWVMDTSHTYCGRIACGQGDTLTEIYRLGDKGERGAQFSMKGEYVRCGRDDDYDSIGIETTFGDIANHPENTATLQIEFLVSRAFPTIDFHMKLDGPKYDSIQYIAYPLGFEVARDQGGRLILPPSPALASAADCRTVAEQFTEWGPAMGTNVLSMNLFAAMQTTASNRQTALIGYLDSQYSELETRCDAHSASATPILHHPAHALRNWRDPYRVRYTMLPDATDDAIAFLMLEHLQPNAL